MANTFAPGTTAPVLSTIAISTDGINNNSTGFQSGGTSYFATVPPRLGAVQEVTVSTAGMGADPGAEGAMRINFVTKRGGDRYHGGVFEQSINDAFNANSWFNNARVQPKSRVRQNQFGGNIGGPLPFTRHKLFFFVNYEHVLNSGTSGASAAFLTTEAQKGIYRYLGTNGQQQAINVPKTLPLLAHSAHRRSGVR